MLLRQIQKNFSKAFDNQNELDQFTQYLKSSHILSTEKGFDVYIKSVHAGLANSLSMVFPVCKKIVGEDFFNQMIFFYIKETASYSPDIGEYGKSFSDFIKKFSPASSLPYLSDVATLEWAWHKAFNGPGVEKLDFLKLQNIDDGKTNDIRFFIPKNASLIVSAYPILHIPYTNEF